MEQIQNNRVITDLYRENAQFPGIALEYTFGRHSL